MLWNWFLASKILPDWNVARQETNCWAVSSWVGWVDMVVVVVVGLVGYWKEVGDASCKGVGNIAERVIC